MLNRLSVPPAGPEGEYESAGGSRALEFDQLLAAARRQARVVGFAAAVGGLLGLAYADLRDPALHGDDRHADRQPEGQDAHCRRRSRN